MNTESTVLDLRYEDQARLLVYRLRTQKPLTVVEYDKIRIVWFAKTLQNWKAMVAVLEPGGSFYEVTHNGDKQETYIDEYQKVKNTVVTDDEFLETTHMVELSNAGNTRHPGNVPFHEYVQGTGTTACIECGKDYYQGIHA